MLDGQFARPRGVVGRFIGRVMARQNATLTRRVVGALNTPMTAGDLVAYAARHDPVNLGPLVDAGVRGAEAILNDLEAAGLVVQLGTYEGTSSEAAEMALASSLDHPDAIDVPKAERKGWLAAAARPDRPPFTAGGRVFIRSRDGHARLEGGISNEPPPLEGERLAAARVQDAEWAANELDIVQSERERSRQREHPSLTEAADKDAEKHTARLREIIARKDVA